MPEFNNPMFNEIVLRDEQDQVIAQPGMLDFGPPPGSLVEIAQNVVTLLRTEIFTVPLDRSIGVDFEFLDLPMPVSMMQMQAEVFQKIQRFEPRVNPEDIRFEGDAAAGHVVANVRLQIIAQRPGQPRIQQTLMP
jgi:uncharacterized protein